MSRPVTPPNVDGEVFEEMWSRHVDSWCDLVRRLLLKYDGYECKEPQKGKFTLAFKSLPNAIAFATTAQVGAADPHPYFTMFHPLYLEISIRVPD